MTILAYFISCLTLFAHPIHIGVTQLDYDRPTQALQITHKLFVDDFEDELEKKYQVRLNLGTATENPKADEYIIKYLSSHFGLSVNGDDATISWVGKEIEKEAIWIYMEISKVKKIKSLEVRHEVMLEAFDDQRNLVHFKYEDFKKSVSCKHKQSTALIEVN